MLFFAILFLFGIFLLTAVISAIRRLHKQELEKQLTQLGNLFFFRKIFSYFFPKEEQANLLFVISCTQSALRFLYAAMATLFLLQNFSGFPFSWSFGLILFLLLGFIIGDYIPRTLGAHLSGPTLRFCSFPASFFLSIIFPFTYLFLKFAHLLPRKMFPEPLIEPLGRKELIELLQNAEFSPALDLHDRKLISSVVNFRERVAREVMVPRVDVFSLPAEMSIKESASLLEEEGYSRVPIYRGTVDNMTGVLMYKDVMAKYMEYEQKENNPKVLAAPIESIQKNILHTPETKKISSLLQEFGKRQVHLAIVVDEYGGTAGIVTIEDILEEIVGEISDEYDEEELFYAQVGNSWIVDARMTIYDVEEELGIKIPEEGDYDTIGGYIFDVTGMIPSKGFVIHTENFDMEILKSNDRCVEKVRINPIKTT